MSPRARASAAGRMAAGITLFVALGPGVGFPRVPPLLAQEMAEAEEADPGIEGRWAGALSVLGSELPFSVTFSRAGDSLSARMDIPAQNAEDLELIEVSREGDRVRFVLDAPIGRAAWDGVHAGDVIEGDFKQGGVTGTFRIERAAPGEAAVGTRTEAGAGAEETAIPGEPPPYREEEISFENGDIRLEGTVTVPEGDGPFPAVAMITGSGPQNRDEELVGFRLFRVIADHLSRNGIAVLRYDDRGVGGSTGDVSASTTADFAGDALAAVARLAEHPAVDPDRIGLIGHSEGGVVAPLAASRSDAVAFIVLLAGTSVPGSEIIKEQSALIARAQGAEEETIARQADFQRRLFEAVAAGGDLAPLRGELAGMIREGIDGMPPQRREAITDVDAFVERQVEGQIGAVSTPWFRYFLTYDPAGALRETDVPVLALFGALDLQVSSEQNVGPMREALGGNPDVTIEVLPGANHLFQEAETGSPVEYASLEKAFVPGLLERVTDWILERAGG